MNHKTLLAGLLIAGLLLSTVPSASAFAIVTYSNGGPSGGSGDCAAWEPDYDGDGVCNRNDPDDDNDAVPDDCDPNPQNGNDIQRWEDWATYVVRGCA